LVENSKQILSRLLSISQAITGQFDYESVLMVFADRLQELIRHDHLDIVLLGEGGRMHYCYEVGMTTSWSELAENPRPTASSPIRTVLWGHYPYILTDDALSDNRFHFSGALDLPIYMADLRSRVIVPMRVHSRVFGALNISNHKVAFYTGEHVQIAQHCADLIAPYLFALQRSEEARKAGAAEVSARTRAETLRTGALRLTEGMEAERRRLAMDLHDQALGDLASLLRHLSRLRERSTVTDADLEVVETELRSTLGELRRLVEDLKPGVLDLFGFTEAVDALLHKTSKLVDNEVRTRFEDRTHGGVDKLPEFVRSALYRIVQEGINNAMRHSTASRVSVTVSRREADLCVEIEDDGIGCRGPVESSKGGVTNMRTRAELIGASFNVGPGPLGKGTRVSVRTRFNEERGRNEACAGGHGGALVPQNTRE